MLNVLTCSLRNSDFPMEVQKYCVITYKYLYPSTNTCMCYIYMHLIQYLKIKNVNEFFSNFFFMIQEKFTMPSVQEEKRNL